MVLGRRHWIIVTLALVLLILLTACERPLGSSDSETAEQAAEATAVAETATAEADVESAAEDEAGSVAGPGEAEEPESSEEAAEEPESSDEVAEEAESGDPDVGGGTPETAAEEATDQGEESEQASTGEDASEEATTDDADSAMADETAAEETTGDETAASDEDTSGDEAAAADSDASEASDETMAAEEDTTADSPALPATHTVAAGENLYRIGLKYGLSWVVLARYNYLPNANYIRVGQVLRIPGGGQPVPNPTPTPPDETGHIDYVVKRGDTLNKIGQRYGVSWLEIAEANGLVNPNLIYAGQVLKIPTSEPDVPPSMTHTVKRGETLYRISLQYGVHWLAIAQANSIAPPYVIYPGQVLAVPGG